MSDDLSATPSGRYPAPSGRVWFRHRAWIPVSWTMSMVNLGAVWFAAAPGEAAHATIHALLGIGFALGAERLRARARAAAMVASLEETLDLNAHLQQMVEDLESRAGELEERLDFADRLLAQQRSAEPPGAPGP